VLLDVPKDVQNQRGSWAAGQGDRAGFGSTQTAPPPRRPAALLEYARHLISSAERPLIMAGHGVLLANASAELLAFAERTGIPVITTLLGISGFPESHPLHLGMPGMHGEVHVNRAIQQADLIIGLGLRFDDRVTGNLASFARGAKVIHVDLDASEIGKNVPVELGLVGDVREMLSALLAVVPARSCEQWRAEIAGFVRPRRESFRGGLSPESILEAIESEAGQRCTIVSDVGQHQMWIAKLYRYQRPGSHITSGGLGTMGFAVPAAMGVALARRGEPVWAISGDGGFQMNMQEMATMVQEGIPVKMGIFNNGYLGMVRQWQQFFHGRRYSATPIWSPDYVRLADAYGIAGWRVESAAELEDAVRAASAEPGPALVEFMIEQEANVYPMIPPGGSLSEPIEGEPAVSLVPA
jgi:acetolactate synthase-1/2/3 large subunit